MKARLLATSELLELVDLLRNDGREVIAPFCDRGRDTFFDVVTDANRKRVQLHVPNPFYPPKRYVLPHVEPLLRIGRGPDDGPPVAGSEAAGTARTESDDALPWHMELLFDSTPRALFGIRSCDVAAMAHLDRFYLGRDPVDPHYAHRRKALFLVNVVCTEPATDIGENCFCLCADTGPAAREGFDLQLMDLGSEEILAVAGTQAGEALLEQPLFRRAEPRHVERRRRILAEVRHQFRNTTSWFPATVRYVSLGSILDQTWEEIGRRCLECGGCTYVCPACTCFTTSDRAIGPNQVERRRLWDSCALGGFTRMAGGHNPRRAVHDRRNRRFFRKLAQYFIERELSMACVGCGRCAAVCHGDIGMPSVVELIRRATAPTVAPAPVLAPGNPP